MPHSTILPPESGSCFYARSNRAEIQRPTETFYSRDVGEIYFASRRTALTFVFIYHRAPQEAHDAITESARAAKK